MSCPQAPSISCLELGSFALEQNARMFFVRFLLILMLLVLNQRNCLRLTAKRSCACIFILYINCVAKNEVTRFLATPKQMAPQGRHLSDWMEAIAKWASWFKGKKTSRSWQSFLQILRVTSVFEQEKQLKIPMISLDCGKGTFCFWKVPNLAWSFKPSSSTL